MKLASQLALSCLNFHCTVFHAELAAYADGQGITKDGKCVDQMASSSVSSCLAAVQNPLSVQLQQHGCAAQKLSRIESSAIIRFRRHIIRSLGS